MKHSLESLVALLLLLLAFALLPEHNAAQSPKEQPLLAITLGELKEVSVDFGPLKGSWRGEPGLWVEEGSAGEAAAFSLLREIAYLTQLPKLNEQQEVVGHIRWKDPEAHEIKLGTPQLGGSIPMELDGVWYLGTMEIMYRLEELKKTLP